MSYDRMKKQEAELAAKVEKILRSAEAADAQEDRQHGKGKRGDELPEDLRHAETRLARIRAAKAELEAEAKAQAAAEAKGDNDDDAPPTSGSTPLPNHRIPREADDAPTPKAQRNS